MEPHFYNFAPTTTYNQINPNESVTLSPGYEGVAQSSTNGDRIHPNPYSYDAINRNKFRGTYSYRYHNTLHQYYDGYPSDAGPTVDWNYDIEDSYNVALSRLYGKIRGNLDISVDIAESSASVRMVKGLKSIERNVLSNKAKTLNSRYLEFIYGWMPLMSSAFGAAEELSRSIDKFAIFRATARFNHKERIANEFYLNSYVPVHYVRKGHYGTTFVIQLENSKDFDISRWTTLNPLSLAWELLPYSFVIDWFYNVGGYMRDLETSWMYANRFRSGYVSTWNKEDCTATINHVFDTGWGDVYTYNVSGNYQRRQGSRTVLNALPLPRTPILNLDLSWRRWVNLGSLIANRLL